MGNCLSSAVAPKRRNLRRPSDRDVVVAPDRDNSDSPTGNDQPNPLQAGVRNSVSCISPPYEELAQLESSLLEVNSMSSGREGKRSPQAVPKPQQQKGHKSLSLAPLPLPSWTRIDAQDQLKRKQAVMTTPQPNDQRNEVLKGWLRTHQSVPVTRSSPSSTHAASLNKTDSPRPLASPLSSPVSANLHFIPLNKIPLSLQKRCVSSRQNTVFNRIEGEGDMSTTEEESFSIARSSDCTSRSSICHISP